MLYSSSSRRKALVPGAEVSPTWMFKSPKNHHRVQNIGKGVEQRGEVVKNCLCDQSRRSIQNDGSYQANWGCDLYVKELKALVGAAWC